MTDQAKERSAFCTRRGLFHFNRMPFGLSGAPATFCRLMQKVLQDQLWKICLFYLDDVIVYAKTHRELLERLYTVISVLGQAGLKVKPSKCTLFKTRISFLGHVVSEQWVDPQPEKNRSNKRLANTEMCARCTCILWTCVLLQKVCEKLCDYCARLLVYFHQISKQNLPPPWVGKFA